jgi:hypothetical protein
VPRTSGELAGAGRTTREFDMANTTEITDEWFADLVALGAARAILTGLLASKDDTWKQQAREWLESERQRLDLRCTP